MNHLTPAPASSSSTYEVRVAGHLDDHWATWLDGLTLVRHDDGTSVLTGPLADQPQLHGLIARIRDLGVPLLSLSTLDPAAPSVESPVRPTPVVRRPVATERLTLRPATDGDADPTWAYRRLPSVTQWLTQLPPDISPYRATFTDPDHLAATVMVEREGRVIGDLRLRIDDAWAQSEVAAHAKGARAALGWVLDPCQTGQGYATEASRGLITHCFTDLGVHRVVATCFLADDKSCRLMARLGMRREAHAVHGSLHRSGRWLDTVTYAVLATEWRSAAPGGQGLSNRGRTRRAATASAPPWSAASRGAPQ
jgi:RimJ/RimL family protein N-acetyltransferase